MGTVFNVVGICIGLYALGVYVGCRHEYGGGMHWVTHIGDMLWVKYYMWWRYTLGYMRWIYALDAIYISWRYALGIRART